MVNEMNEESRKKGDQTVKYTPQMIGAWQNSKEKGRKIVWEEGGQSCVCCFMLGFLYKVEGLQVWEEKNTL